MFIPHAFVEECLTIDQLQEVMKIKDVINRWHDLGLELVDSYKELKDIKAKHPNEISACCHEMFKKWLYKTHDANWKQLITALDDLGMNTAANAIIKQFKLDEQLPCIGMYL